MFNLRIFNSQWLFKNKQKNFYCKNVGRKYNHFVCVKKKKKKLLQKHKISGFRVENHFNWHLKSKINLVWLIDILL